MTEVSKKNEVVLKRVPYIHYLLHFRKDIVKVKTLLDFGSKINTMMPAFALKLGLKVRPTNFGAQKIDGSIFKTFEIVLASFQVKDKLGKARFFQETFLLADISVEVGLEMPFFTLSNTDI